ncbi:MAG TPA: hypothetical protein PL042_01675 [Caldisericia bacterium]|nr:hypothetical protein [Caldisericia bacterium]
MYEIGEKAKIIIKPEYNNNKQITYTGTIIEKEGNKILILTIKGERKIIDIETISEYSICSEESGSDGKRYNQY